MRIAIFTNNYLPNPYGVSTSIETFRRELEKKGHTVYIFAPRFPGYIDNDPRVFRYPSLNFNFKIKFPLPVPFSRRISKILRNLELDVIHAQHPNLLGWAARRWAKKKKIPLIFTWHTLYDKYVNFVPLIPKKLAAGYIIRKAVRYANRADAVIIPTSSIAPIIKEWGVKNKNITAIPTGVNEEEFQNADRNPVRQKYSFQKEDIVLMTVSRLTEEKNVDFLFRSIKKPLTERKDMKFLVAGAGYLEGHLKEFCRREKISDQVKFCGLVSRAGLKDHFAAADIFVYASKSETQGMVISEAMYMGLPVVAVNATGASSLVLNRANGILVDEDEEEFSRAVIKLSSDPQMREKFGLSSAQVARSQFTSAVTAEKLLEVYRNLMK